MMEFEVLWNSEAYESIAEIYDDSEDPSKIAAALSSLDNLLRTEPGTRGESRVGGRRIVFAPPLGALIQIDWRLNRVFIAEVWKYETHEE